MKEKRANDAARDAFLGALREYIQKRHDGNQTQAAKALGVSQGHISSLLSGKRGPGLGIVVELAEQTGQTVDALLGLSGSSREDQIARAVVKLITQQGIAVAQAAEEPEPARLLPPAKQPRRRRE